MELIYQDCGCVAFPDEVIAALGLVPGSVMDGVIHPGSRSITLTANESLDRTSDAIVPLSCRVTAAGA